MFPQGKPTSSGITLHRLRHTRCQVRSVQVLSFSNFHFHTFMFTLSLSHFHNFTFTRSLSQFHFHTFTFTLSHFYFHTFTSTLSGGGSAGSSMSITEGSPLVKMFRRDGQSHVCALCFSKNDPALWKDVMSTLYGQKYIINIADMTLVSPEVGSF